MPYYNHDKAWLIRKKKKTPLWGSFSMKTYDRLLVMIKERFPSGKVIWDIGCGAGMFPSLLRHAGYESVGFDESHEAISLGKKYFSGTSLERVDFATSSVPNLSHHPIPDAITCVNVMHCLLDDAFRDNFIRNISSWAPLDSLIIITTMCQPVLKDTTKSNPPRNIKEPKDIEIEWTNQGWQTLFQEVTPPNQINFISNLTLILKRVDNAHHENTSSVH